MGVISSSDRSAELSQQSGTRVEAHQKIRPLRDQIIVEPLPIEHSQTLEVYEYGKPVRGIVKAVGPGHYPKIYDHPDKHKRTSMRDSKTFLPTQVKVGEIVELGSPQGMRGYAFQQIMWGDKMHIICSERDVAAVLCSDEQT